ncbi:MAG: esterase TesA [Acidobacteriaceae bacterium]
MRSLWLSLILVAAAGAFGCHAKEPAARPPDPDSVSVPSQIPSEIAQPAPADKRPILVCFGDSLTAGHGTDPGQSYPDFLQKDLDQRGFNYHVVNEGISGNTTKDGLNRIDRVIALHPALVVVEFGGNDGLRGLRIEDTRASLDAILARLKSTGAKIALAGITLPPDYGPDYIQQFQQTYTLLARKYSVPLLPFLLQGVYGVDGMMQEDRTHATGRGNQVVAENILHLITPMLRKN